MISSNQVMKKFAIFAGLFLAVGCSLLAADKSKSGTFKNPLLARGPDPWVLWHDGEYFYIRAARESLVLTRTKDVTKLASAANKTIWIPKEASNKHHLWAPEIHFIAGKWYVYYAADDGNSDNHQLYVLENASADPFAGEFVMKSRISTDNDNNWAIDGTVFENAGSWYLSWSGWQTRRVDTETQCIYLAKLKNPWTLASERVVLSKPELDWERHYRNAKGWNPDHVIYVNEGPEALKSPDGKLIHIVYSASGCWTPDYALGLLTAKADADLLDPKSWTKSQQPVFHQSPENRVYGTGHCCFFKSPDGTEDYILYHARDTRVDPPGKDVRSPRAQEFHWTSEGYPVFGVPYSTAKLLKKPSAGHTNNIENKVN
jgi:GH43 family beta-xylosidase